MFFSFVVLDFSFSSDSYTITEAENNLSFEVKSLGTHNVDVVFKYSTKMMSYTTNGNYHVCISSGAYE